MKDKYGIYIVICINKCLYSYHLRVIHIYDYWIGWDYSSL